MTTPTSGGPTVRRILVGAQLRRLREERGITREDAGYVIRASGSKISRLELGRVSFKERDIADLLKHYGVDDAAQVEALLALARDANRPGWWHDYDDVLPNWFQTYVGLEESASLIRTFEVQFIPGLLQTEDYARSVTMSGRPDLRPDEIERRVGLRMKRQNILDRPNPPKVWAVIDEAALRRPIGGSKVMRAQLRYLLELIGAPARDRPGDAVPVRRACRRGRRRSASCASPSRTCRTWSTSSSWSARCTWTSARTSTATPRRWTG